MKVLRVFQRWAGSLILLFVGLSSANAEQVLINASFKPDSAHPLRNKFTNDTPASGYCAQAPQQCKDNEMFSLQVPIQFNSQAPILANHGSIRQGAMFEVPTQWRDLTVTHLGTGETKTLKVRIAGLGSTYVTEDIMKLVGPQPDYREAHWKLWDGTWVNTPLPCTYSGVAFYWDHAYKFFWKTPNQGVCSRQAKFDIPWLRYDYLDFAYELETPKPLEMSSGVYVGHLTYTLGPRADFDFGDIMLPSSSALTLNFELEVQHTLKVDIPPGGTRVELVPQGGWQAWLSQGRKPTRLLRDQTFNISTSSRFKMLMKCQYPAGDTCAVQDPAGNQAPLQVAVTLPSGLTTEGGRAVIRQPLRVSGVGTELFQPGIYVDRKPGTLHFGIEQGDVADMLSREAATYKGNVTVIWDSEVG
ncbi:hypothetical protein [Pseudomonas sp. TH15]|uniref:hypothetical protein n=1 Tax=Pseudomonas sp. TH15 TaxID=2796381 RepID=UPI0019144059|nr:hypothetical protein [Pseudomonas sp. TH15]MBK5513687.1 hypothetical protein [Pseudomonas sp. TH15]